MDRGAMEDNEGVVRDGRWDMGLICYRAVVDGEGERGRSSLLRDAEEDAVELGGAEFQLDVGHGSHAEVVTCDSIQFHSLDSIGCNWIGLI